MNKLYDRIDFENDNVPALNADNLNAISKALDDIDTRVTKIYKVEEAVEKADEIIKAGAELVALSGGIDIATEEKAGLIKPDGVYTNVDDDGTLNITEPSNTDYDVTTQTFAFNFIDGKSSSYALPIYSPKDKNYITVGSFLKKIIDYINRSINGVIDTMTKVIPSAQRNLFEYMGGVKLIDEGVIDGITTTISNVKYMPYNKVWVAVYHGYGKGTPPKAQGTVFQFYASCHEGVTTTANAAAKTAVLGTIGTAPFAHAATYEVVDGAYVSKIGIAAATTAVKLKYKIYEVLGCDEDF